MVMATELAIKYGMLSVGEVKLIHKCVIMLPENPVIINIGAGFGTSVIAMLEKRPDAFIFSIDKKPRSEEYENLLASKIDTSRCLRILSDSRRAGKNFPYMVDLVFVDGAHHNTAVKGDIETWLPKLNADGIILFHDYHHKNVPHLTTIVDKAMKGHRKIGEERYLIAFKI